MQVIAFSTPRSIVEANLLVCFFKLRARVFSDRLGWEVDVREGCESDAFDALRPTYVLAVTETGQLAGGARLLPATGPTMAVDVFPSLLPKGELNAHSAMVESSRFCVDTSLMEGRGAGAVHEATRTMFAGIIEWCVANSITEIVTVTDLRLERLLARVGWSLRRLAEPRKIGVTTAVAGVLTADIATFEALRPSNYRSSFRPISKAA